MSDQPIAIGCMRLSTDPDRVDERSIAVLHAALDAGVTLLDTADAYCLDDTDTGHNERLIARALASWTGDRSRIVVATKGGMTRPAGRWDVDGRAKHLRIACERSCAALGVTRIQLYQLHAPDPRVPFATSVRALAALKREGLIEHVGLSNVTVGQIEEARRITEIAAIQIELSIWNDAAILGGVVPYCIEHGIRVLAYRPLGGRKSIARTRAHPVLQHIARDRHISPADVALAWLTNLSDLIVPLPGVTRVETAVASARAQKIVLSGDEREALNDAFRRGAPLVAPSPPAVTSPPGDRAAEVVMIMGVPAAGKSTLSESFVADGYRRINRDAAGGSLKELTLDLDRALDDGASRIVLDNTYVSRKSRAEVLHAAVAHGAPVRCVWLATTIDDAQVNAASRLIERYGRLPADEELSALRKKDVAAFGPTVLFRYQRELEPPQPGEGFASIETIPFQRRWPADYTNRAVIVWLGEADPGLDTIEVLQQYHRDGYPILGLSWQPGLADDTISVAIVEARFARIHELLGFPIEMHYCPHAAGPPRCWCRKPLPGLGVLLIHRHRLDPAQCIYLGSGSVDAAYARKLGFEFRAV